MGTNNNAANAANAANEARQKAINASVAQIQSAYGSPVRQAQYDQYGKSLNDYYTNQVNEQEAQNARNLKFAMARSGLTGGSASADANTQLQKDYTQGLIQASQQAMAGKSALKQADINSENQLVSLAEQGDMTGSIPSEITSSEQANLNAAQNYDTANALNGLFGNTARIYNTEQTAAATRAAQMNPIGSPYGSQWGSGSIYGTGW